MYDHISYIIEGSNSHSIVHKQSSVGLTVISLWIYSRYGCVHLKEPVGYLEQVPFVLLKQ